MKFSLSSYWEDSQSAVSAESGLGNPKEPVRSGVGRWGRKVKPKNLLGTDLLTGLAAMGI